MAEFGPLQNGDDDLIRLMSLRKTGSMSEYVNRTRQLVRGVDSSISQNTLIHIFYNGLPLEDRKALGGINGRTLDRICRDAIENDVMHREIVGPATCHLTSQRPRRPPTVGHARTLSTSVWPAGYAFRVETIVTSQGTAP